jgi:hypothetical protein
MENDVVRSTFLQGVRLGAFTRNEFDQWVHHENGDNGQPHPPRTNHQAGQGHDRSHEPKQMGLPLVHVASSMGRLRGFAITGPIRIGKVG